MALSPAITRNWQEILTSSLGQISSRLASFQAQQDREEREATPDVEFSQEIQSRPHSFRMQCEQLESSHTPDEIETAYQDIQRPEFFYMLMAYQLLAAASIDPLERERGHLPALREAVECLWKYLGALGADPEDVRKRIGDQWFWEQQVRALQSYELRMLASGEPTNSAPTLPRPTRKAPTRDPPATGNKGSQSRTAPARQKSFKGPRVGKKNTTKGSHGYNLRRTTAQERHGYNLRRTTANT